jgi:adenylate cyclase
MLRLSIFGRFQAADALGNEIPIKSKKARALLAYLALPPGKERSREEVMALLWSERGDEQARSSLRQALSGLRKELGEIADGTFKVTDEWLALDPELVVVEPASPSDELLAGLHINDPAFDEWLRDERLRHEDVAAPNTHTPEPPLPDKPSIAVLPFVNMSGDPEQEYFADGITEDIITELSRFHALSVIARNSAFHYKGKSPKIQDIGGELGVGYVVEGSVRKEGNRVRITVQLVDAATGNHIWAERYDRDLEDIFAVQDEVTRIVVSTVASRIDSVGYQRATRMSPDSLKAYDLFLRAKSIFLRFTRADNAEARDLLKRAIALDPANAQAHAVLCETYFMDWVGNWVEDGDHALNEAVRWGKEAVAVDDADSRSHWTLGEAYLLTREFDKARFHLEKAIGLNPNDVEALTIYGFFLTCVREIPEAIAVFERARQVDPQDLNYLPWLEGFAYFTARQYEEAIACFEKVEDPHYEVYSLLAASYAYVGRLNDAKPMLEEFLCRAEQEMVDCPGRSLAAWKRNWHSLACYEDEADGEHWLHGLRKAGLEG